MKTNLKFIGIDVSKSTLDICVLSEHQESFKIDNTPKSIRCFFSKHLSSKSVNYVCMENTGKYGWSLMELLSELECLFYVINPLHLKKSMGLVRGKNDKIDALRIAKFIKSNYAEVAPFTAQRLKIKDLQVLLTERKHRIKQRKALVIKNKEYLCLTNKKMSKQLTTKNNRLIKELDKQIKDFELSIQEIVKQDQKLLTLHKQLVSTPGVGKILAWNLLVKTNEFKTITKPRKLACYAGVAPFENTSGTSIFRKPKVSNFADKELKRLLHLGAMSAIRLENDLSIYYHRKVDEGKNKMSVLNAVRNKIIHIIFALIKNQTFYQNRLVTS
ncbi:transposase [Aquimarina sp. EL_43]|jgi:transposase|uniref:IS110 family transposase n=1 Tax=unclassified Aquimarina TaxID=2627091 RepID=UPI0018CBABA1|nr:MULTISPECIES: IS110 family transposase [unclassified Aquimarina]MBG6133806.1 transposase [Aquimarina sp. EL_35]MBG6153963.1 transposase [Aquimarina sp. EL_32]MBG6172197.1 transposase [Aquimarina sp. EL_43]